ncbi:hypothetical protein CAEBREN_22175 [Caenorhabditis brenneri]|uniref:Integrase catalytic domain-containing protein n=1 Tax=Caenorhabditis brenneri TaxID=135651 RepID=G0PM19_CAEBE|nr:hypothetical protein CAEBREN_22175 [Caenorhabditis brenneri]
MKLAWQSTILVVGPSGQGKSTLARKIVDQRNTIFDADSKICFWYYDTFESVPDSMKNRKDIMLREGLPNLEELKKYKKDQAMIVIDDLMTKIDQNSGMERLVSVLAHHYNMTVMFLLHTIFYSKVIRNLRLQTKFAIVIIFSRIKLLMSSSQNNWNLDVFKEIVALSSTSDENARIALINALPDETLICLVEMVYNILNGSMKLSKPHIQRLKPHSEDLRHLSNIRNIDEARSFLVQTEHEDLIANKKEDPIKKLLDTPMENDVKLAHLQDQLTKLIKRRMDNENAEKTQVPEKVSKYDEDKGKAEEEVKKDEEEKKDDILTPNVQTQTPPQITAEEAKKKLKKHFNLHPDHFRTDTKSGDFFVRDLKIDEHEDLIANKKEDPIKKLLDTPMENDVKLAHLQDQLTKLIKRRMDNENAEKTQVPEKVSKYEEDKGKEEEEEKKDEEKKDDILTPKFSFTPTLDSFTTPTHRGYPPASPLSSTISPSIQTQTPLRITAEEAKKKLKKHFNLHPDHFRTDTKSGDFFVRDLKIDGYTINRILDDFTNVNPISTNTPGLKAISMHLKETDFPEEYILNPKRKYSTRANIFELLEKLYHDPKSGFRGVSTLYNQARKLNPKIKREHVLAYLHSNETYTRHFPKAQNVQHNPWVADGPNTFHMADLAMLDKLKTRNKGFSYILVVVDVFSRYVFARPLKNKKCQTVTEAYKDILLSTRRIPSCLYTDKGTEFTGRIFREFLASLNIVFRNPKNTNVKACYAENAIMRIKNKLEKWFTTSKSLYG